MHENPDDKKRVTPPAEAEQTKEEQDLDEALYDTFPASDPLPVTPQAEPALSARGEESDRKREAYEAKRK